MIRNTPCECDGPGFCTRHQCVKGHGMFHRCRKDQRMFQAWEEGRGPCIQVPAGSVDEPSVDADDDQPGILRRAMNFGAALARHAANRMRNVDDARYQARIDVCRDCPQCDVPGMVCRERGCGCFLQTKARWASEDCPLRKWPKNEEIGIPPPEIPLA